MAELEDDKNEKEVETIHGFDIPKRELTEEEATREVTLKRFQIFHHQVGEDFVDQFPYVNVKIFGGYMMAKHPDLSTEILKIVNNKWGEALGIKSLIDKNYDDSDADKFYTELAEFINLTGNLKKMVNQVLIQVDEYYKD